MPRSVSVLRRFVVTCLCPLALLPAQEPGIEFFEKKIRPVLAAHCYGCHSAKVATGGLRLDSRDAIRTGGNRGPAVVPEDVEASVLVRAVSYQDSALRMPPAGKLNDSQIADLREWVRMGAPDYSTASR